MGLRDSAFGIIRIRIRARDDCNKGAMDVSAIDPSSSKVRG